LHIPASYLSLSLAFFTTASRPLAVHAQASPLPPVARSHVTFRVLPSPGPLTGTVREADGHTVWNARVWLDADSAIGTWTGMRGRFRLPAPTPGAHQLTVRLLGFQPLLQMFTVLEHTGIQASVILAPTHFRGPETGVDPGTPTGPDSGGPKSRIR
jgi:hypothetical protein